MPEAWNEAKSAIRSWVLEPDPGSYICALPRFGQLRASSVRCRKSSPFSDPG